MNQKQQKGKTALIVLAIICILLIGIYFLYRGVAVTINNARRRERERLSQEDKGNDPANA